MRRRLTPFASIQEGTSVVSTPWHPSSPCPLLPQGEKGEAWRPDAQNRRRKGLPEKPVLDSPQHPTHDGIRRYCVTACATKSMVNTTSSLTFATNGTLGIWRL
jgi:hypothetical protein